MRMVFLGWISGFALAVAVNVTFDTPRAVAALVCFGFCGLGVLVGEIANK
jgi:predicted naringenin-chalcone synthase